MASAVDICNLALAHLGDEATVSSIDPAEGSAQAEHCERWYPIARDTLLEMHDWRFATRRVLLAALSANAFEWSFAYALPSNMVRALKVLPAASSAQNDTEDFDQMVSEEDAQIILTNCEDASLVYTVRVTDTTRFTPLFVESLAWLLASYLAGPVLKGDAGQKMAQTALANFGAFYARATASDANQRQVKATHTPDWIVNR